MRRGVNSSCRQGVNFSCRPTPGTLVVWWLRRSRVIAGNTSTHLWRTRRRASWCWWHIVPVTASIVSAHRQSEQLGEVDIDELPVAVRRMSNQASTGIDCRDGQAEASRGPNRDRTRREAARRAHWRSVSPPRLGATRADREGRARVLRARRWWACRRRRRSYRRCGVSSGDAS